MPIKKRVTGKLKASPIKLRGSAAAAADTFKYDRDRRAAAALSHNKGYLLDPNEVKGEYDMQRMLTTTIGTGARQHLTHEHLAQFRHNVKVAGTAFKGGITIQQVINLSEAGDRERANQQIHMAVPAGANRGKIRFVTNSGPDSKVNYHHVEVSFNDYDSAISSPIEPKKLAYQLVKKSTVKIQCSCERFTFFFRYVATVGGYVLGRLEKSYPKIRNPGLSGVACKHLLRVMKELDSNIAIRNLIAKMIDKAQREDERLHTVVSQEEADKIAKKQLQRKKEIVVKDIKAKATPAGKTLVKKVAEKKPPPTRSPALKKMQDQKAAQLLADLKQLPPEQLAALLAQLK